MIIFALVRYIHDICRWQIKSLYRSRAGRHFYGTGYVIWTGFGPVGNTKKKIGPIMINFWRRFFHVFGGKKKFKKKILKLILCSFSVRTLQHFQKTFNIFLHPKTWKKRPQKLLIIGPNFFFSVLPIGPKPAQITFSVP